MPNIGTTYSYGLRDVKITLFAPPNTQIDLPASTQIKVDLAVNTAELKGDDVIQAVHTVVEKCEWEVVSGGVPFDAWALMMGATVTNSGSTPNRVDTLPLKSTDTIPYIKIYGKVVGVTGDDLHLKIMKAKLTKSPSGTFQNGEFFTGTISGIGIPDGSDKIVEFVQNETAATLPAS